MTVDAEQDYNNALYGPCPRCGNWSLFRSPGFEYSPDTVDCAIPGCRYSKFVPEAANEGYRNVHRKGNI